MENRSITAEDYLKAIDEFTLYNGFASLSEIAHLLGTARQSAYDEIKILVQRGFVERQSRGQYVLTKKGSVEANIFLRKHRIAEILLWKSLSLPWETIDDEAMGIEHGITETIAEAVCIKYGCDSCPHGNPVPDETGRVKETDDIFFNSLEPDREYRISRVIFENSSILHYLGTHSLLPGHAIATDHRGAVYIPRNGNEEVPETVARAITYLTFDE
ncbi:MAG: metal-dependent transcriptional regulator [Thermoplasmataceae archaeon]